MNDNSLIPIAIAGLSIIAIITIPILISHLSSKNITGYECGVHITPDRVSPYCKIEF